MKTHDLKTWPEYFYAVLSGRKKHEVRSADRDFAVGTPFLPDGLVVMSVSRCRGLGAYRSLADADKLGCEAE